MRRKVRQSNPRAGLFADAETGEDTPEQVIGAEGTGDFPQHLLGLAQVFGQQLTGSGQGQLATPMFQGRAGLAQGFQMATTGTEAAFSRLLVAHAGFQVLAQQIQAGAGLGRQADGDVTDAADEVAHMERLVQESLPPGAAMSRGEIRIGDDLVNDKAPGERGILVHCDLANYNAVTTILTEDVGLWAGHGENSGFLLLGRAEGAAAK